LIEQSSTEWAFGTTGEQARMEVAGKSLICGQVVADFEPRT
jgi:hypothetical protein